VSVIVKEEVSRNPKVGRGWVARVKEDGEIEFIRSLQWSKYECFFKPEPGAFYIIKKDTSSWKNRHAKYWLKTYDEQGNATVIVEAAEGRGWAEIKYENQEYDEEGVLKLLDRYGCLRVEKGKNRIVQLLVKIALERMSVSKADTETEKATAEVTESEAFSGWEGIEGFEVTAVPEGAEITKEEVEKIRQKVLSERFMQMKIIVFELPTEYLGASKKYNKKKDGKFTEEIVFAIDPNRFRTLRKKFYNALNRVAWKSKGFWVLLKEPDKKQLEAFNEIMKQLNNLAKNLGWFAKNRSVQIVEAYFPRYTVQQWLAQYIAEVKESAEKIREKIQQGIEDAKKLKQAERRLNELENRIFELEKELESIKNKFRRE